MSAIRTVRNLKRPGSEPGSPQTPRKPSAPSNPASPVSTPRRTKSRGGSWSDLSASTSSMGMSLSTNSTPFLTRLSPRTDIDLSRQREVVRRDAELRAAARIARERTLNTTEQLPATLRARTLVLLVAEARRFQLGKRLGAASKAEDRVSVPTKPRCDVDLCRRDLFQDVVNDIHLLMSKPRPAPTLTRRSCGNLGEAARDVNYNHTVTELSLLRLWN